MVLGNFLNCYIFTYQKISGNLVLREFLFLNKGGRKKYQLKRIKLTLENNYTRFYN